MPNLGKGPHLWFRKPRKDRNGKITHEGVWIIIDGDAQQSTKCGRANRAGAERELQAYFDRKHTVETTKGFRDPAEIPVADVISFYATRVVPGHARPKESTQRVDRLLGFFIGKWLSDINGDLCRSYLKGCSSKATAREDLSLLRAAINFHREEGHCEKIVSVVLPDKSAGRERWMTRGEAARLLWSAWRFRETQKGVATDRHTRRHVARFILVALYTGTRAGAVCSAALEPTEGRGWIDLDKGIFFRRPAGTQETKKRRPPVPLPRRLLAHLRRWKRAGAAFAVEWNGQGIKDCDKAFRNVAREAGLPDVTPHILRHTAATWLMQAGVDKWESAGYLGMSADQLERTYGHHHPDHLRGPRDAFDRAPMDRQSNTTKEAGYPQSNVRRIADGSR